MKKNLTFLSALCLIGSVIIGCAGSPISVVSIEVETLPDDINIDIDNSESQATLSPGSLMSENGQIKRKWVSHNQWKNQPGLPVHSLQLHFSQNKNGGCGNRHSWTVANQALKEKVVVNWPKSKADGEPLSVAIEGTFGNILFEGELGKPQGQNVNPKATAFGTMTLTPDTQKLQAIETAFGQKVLLDDLVTMITKNIDVEDMEGLADCSVTFTLSEAIELVKHNKKASDVKNLIDSGYAFKGKEIVKLTRYYVSFDQAVAWRKARYALSVDDLIYARQRYLKPQKAVAWKKVGYELNLKQLYWVKQRYLKTESAAAWKKAKYVLNLEELYWIKQRYLKPKKATAWKKAGYTLDLKKLYWAKQRYLNPDIAGKWKNIGYTLSLDDLYYAKQHYLKPEKAAVWKKAGYTLNLKQLYYAKQHYLDEKEALAWKNNGYDFSLKDLYQLKQHYVKASYGAMFADPHYKLPNVKQLIEFKRGNISAETVKQIRKKAECHE